MMCNILFPEAFETALGETSLAVFFFYAAFDKLFRIKDAGIRSKAYKRLACMQDKNEQAAGGIKDFFKRGGLKVILEIPGSGGDRERRD
jgi:hypothetical protein